MEHIIVDSPLAGVSRITLNRPESRNALNNTLRGEIYSTLEANDTDESIRVTVIRGAGKAFCAGYDLKASLVAWNAFLAVFSCAGSVCVDVCLKGRRGRGSGLENARILVGPFSAVLRQIF